jgi:hypothetical protein
VDINKWREQLRQDIKNFTLFDDPFMTVCFKDSKECVELILRIIMEKPNLQVKRVHTEHPLKNLQGRSLTLDVLAVDNTGKSYNIEVQNAPSGAGLKRARYHAALLDSAALKPGEEWDNLPETYVIFITKDDVFKRGLPLYHIDRYIEDIMEKADDGLHIVYVNGSCRNSSTALGKLMHDFSCKQPEEMYYNALAERARRFKENEGEEAMEAVPSWMQKYVDESWQEDIARGEARGIAQGRMQAMQDIFTLWEKGITPAEAKKMLEV